GGRAQVAKRNAFAHFFCGGVDTAVQPGRAFGRGQVQVTDADPFGHRDRHLRGSSARKSQSRQGGDKIFTHCRTPCFSTSSQFGRRPACPAPRLCAAKFASHVRNLHGYEILTEVKKRGNLLCIAQNRSGDPAYWTAGKAPSYRLAMDAEHLPDSILIVDFGSQVTQLIARRVREAGVYSEIAPFSMAEAAFERLQPKGIILSGSPAGVPDEGSPRAPQVLFDSGLPILGICYGQ